MGRWHSGWALWPIFEVCAGEKWYERGGCRKDAWWHQEVSDKHLKTTLNEILWEVRRRRRGERTHSRVRG